MSERCWEGQARALLCQLWLDTAQLQIAVRKLVTRSDLKRHQSSEMEGELT